jgi:hypothetical protein
LKVPSTYKLYDGTVAVYDWIPFNKHTSTILETTLNLSILIFIKGTTTQSRPLKSLKLLEIWCVPMNLSNLDNSLAKITYVWELRMQFLDFITWRSFIHRSNYPSFSNPSTNIVKSISSLFHSFSSILSNKDWASPNRLAIQRAQISAL